MEDVELLQKAKDLIVEVIEGPAPSPPSQLGFMLGTQPQATGSDRQLRLAEVILKYLEVSASL